MFNKLTFKSKQDVEHFIDEMFKEYSYEASFGSALPNSIQAIGEWVTIKLANGFYHFLEGSDGDYIHYWTNGNTYDRDIKETLIKWLWEDRYHKYRWKLDGVVYWKRQTKALIPCNKLGKILDFCVIKWTDF